MDILISAIIFRFGKTLKLKRLLGITNIWIESIAINRIFIIRNIIFDNAISK